MSGKCTTSIDSKGRVLIPQSMRDALNIKKEERLVLSLDMQNRSVVIEPSHEKKLLHLEILLSDKPGALAHAAAALAEIDVDLVSTQSHSSRRGEAATWVVECNPHEATLPKIKGAIERAGAKLEGAKII